MFEGEDEREDTLFSLWLTISVGLNPNIMQFKLLRTLQAKR